MHLSLIIAAAGHCVKADWRNKPVFLFLGTLLLPGIACAADASPFGGVTDFLRNIANLLIMEWGYYIGIITLAIQGYRWKIGSIDLMQLGGWGLGIGLVFFAPNIVLY